MSTMQSKEPGLVGVSVSDFLFDKSIDKFIDVYSHDFGSKIESSEHITFDGQPATMFIINGGNNTHLLQVTLLNDQRKYDITTPITNGSSNPTIQSMLNSLNYRATLLLIREVKIGHKP